MADSVLYTLGCECGERLYAAWDRIDQCIMYWPEITWPDCHDPVERCRGCDKRIEE